MVTRKRLRSILTALGLYVLAALLIGYFGVNAFSGNHGLKAKQDIDQQIASLSTELAGCKHRAHAMGAPHRACSNRDGLDPDMLDERARALLDYAHPNDLTLMIRPSRSGDRPAALELHAWPAEIIFAANRFGAPEPTLRAPTSAISRFRLWDGTRDVSRTLMAVAQTKEAEPLAQRTPPRRRSRRAVRASAEFDKDEEFQALRQMLLIRRFEEKAGQMYGMGLIGGFCHLYIGQEAVVVGMQMAKRDGDQMITGYRDHGHMLACGMDPKGVMAELTGRRGGYSKGKGGSMHMFSREKNFYGGHGIVGAPGADRHRARFRQQVSRQRQRSA